MGSDFRYTMLHAHAHLTLGSASILTSVFALTTLPAFIPLVLHLAILLFYAPHLVNRQSKVFFLWIGLTIAKSYHWLTPSINALSTPFTSISVLLAHGAITSFISLLLVLVYTRSRTRIQGISLWSRALLFPTLWATAWWTMALLSPVGYLTSWSPVIGFSAYDWMIPIFGSPIRDWLVASWAVVFAGFLEAWYMGSEAPEEVPLLVQVPVTSRTSPGRHFGTLSLGVVLLALTVPCYVWPSNFARSISASDSTPVEVGCVLPHNGHKFKDYIDETMNLQSRASSVVLLWPEGAVSFADEAERDGALAELRQKIQPQKYVGVSFEESYKDPDDPSGRRSLQRTGLALVSNNTNAETPLFFYYKRNLVPIAESYRLVPGHNPPPLITLDVNMPKWASKPKKRSLSVTASICLDFAIPDVFSGLVSKPELILAPARTWDISVGQAMWEQAKQRARELDSMVLWCDGGEGGVSGIAGQGINGVMQVGEGSWTRAVGLEYPADDRRKLYARMGGSGVTIGILWILVVGTGMSRIIMRIAPGSGWAMNTLSSLRKNFQSWRERQAVSQVQGESNLLMD